MNNLIQSIFQLLGDFSSPYFTNEAENQNLYAYIGVILFFVSVFFSYFFYLIINHPRFNRFTHWLIVLGVNFFINFLIALVILHVSLEAFDELDYIVFSIKAGVISVPVFVISSFVFKKFSRNCSATPFPI